MREVADIEALFLLVPLSLVAVGAAVLVFFRMNADGQFDDAEGPAWSVLMDDDRGRAPDESEESCPTGPCRDAGRDSRR